MSALQQGPVSRVAGGWLTAEMPLAAAGAIHPWTLLRSNGRLDGSARVALHQTASGALAARLRVDLPVADGADDLVVDAPADLMEAQIRVTAPAGSLEQPRPEPAAGEGREPLPLDELAERCDEAGWAPEVLAPDRLELAMTTHDGGLVAVGTAVPRGLRLAVEIAAGCAPSIASRGAIGLFLLLATDQLRGVRASRGPDDGKTAALYFEVLVGRAPSAELLAMALGALETACCFCAAEVEALCDEAIARRYLEIRRVKFPSPTPGLGNEAKEIEP